MSLCFPTVTRNFSDIWRDAALIKRLLRFFQKLCEKAPWHEIFHHKLFQYAHGLPHRFPDEKRSSAESIKFHFKRGNGQVFQILWPQQFFHNRKVGSLEKYPSNFLKSFHLRSHEQNELNYLRYCISRTRACKEEWLFEKSIIEKNPWQFILQAPCKFYLRKWLFKWALLINEYLPWQIHP